MGFNSRSPTREVETETDQGSPTTLDHETLRRMDHALEGTINVDVSKLDPDDKLTLLIERYNRKIRELQELKSQDQ